eukprot:1159184-Pelagomonas_calceolata.AAC.11
MDWVERTGGGLLRAIRGGKGGRELEVKVFLLVYWCFVVCLSNLLNWRLVGHRSLQRTQNIASHPHADDKPLPPTKLETFLSTFVLYPAFYVLATAPPSSSGKRPRRLQQQSLWISVQAFILPAGEDLPQNIMRTLLSPRAGCKGSAFKF